MKLLNSDWLADTWATACVSDIAPPARNSAISYVQGASWLWSEPFFFVMANSNDMLSRIADLPALCKRLRLSDKQPWNVEHISPYYHQNDNSLPQNVSNAKRNENPFFAHRFSSSHWSRGSRGASPTMNQLLMFLVKLHYFIRLYSKRK